MSLDSFQCNVFEVSLFATKKTLKGLSSLTVTNTPQSYGQFPLMKNFPGNLNEATPLTEITSFRFPREIFLKKKLIFRDCENISYQTISWKKKLID